METGIREAAGLLVPVLAHLLYRRLQSASIAADKEAALREQREAAPEPVRTGAVDLEFDDGADGDAEVTSLIGRNGSG